MRFIEAVLDRATRDLSHEVLNNNMSSLAAKYKSVRSMTRSLAASSSAEDQMAP
jgi:hypothetical protein